MLHELNGAYVVGEANDMQTECIDIFFGAEDFFKENFDVDLSDHEEDEDVDFLINLVVNNMELDDHIEQMLIDWRENGF